MTTIKNLILPLALFLSSSAFSYTPRPSEYYAGQTNELTDYGDGIGKQVTCGTNYALSAVQCIGDNCDQFRVYCAYQGSAFRGDPQISWWTHPFSEESGVADCNQGAYSNKPIGINYGIATGISCNGTHCDNVRLRCTSVSPVASFNDNWTGWHSEEYDSTLALPGVAWAAQCKGNYCDEIRFWSSNVRIP